MSDHDAERWIRLKDAFASLIELPFEDRGARLASIAASDAELHQRLAALLDADTRADSVLSRLEIAPPSDEAVFPDDGGRAAPDPLGLCGRTVSHFRLIDVLGAGGMGVVYRAEDELLGRTVALKFPLPEYSLDPLARERFLREARAASALDHPSVCTVYEAGESELGHPFLAMACYTGETLKTRLARSGALPIDEAMDITRALLHGIGAAHAAGVVHRDLKPANIMLVAGGGVKILDFGLAKVRDLSGTATGHRPGTAAYMSPEQIEGEAVDGRSDLWSLGVVMHEMLTGQRPFGGGPELSMVYGILREDPDPPSRARPDVSSVCDAVVRRLLFKNPEDRFPIARAVLAELGMESPLRELSQPPAVRHRRNGRLVALAFVLLVAIGGVSAAVRSRYSANMASVEGKAKPVAVLQVVARPTTHDVGAYELYLKGKTNAGTRGREELEAAAAFFRDATERDTAFAAAFAELAHVFVTTANLGFKPVPEMLARADSAVERALALDPSLGEAYSAKGYVLASRGSYDAADASFRKAIELNQSSAGSHHYYSLFLMTQGRTEDAARQNDEAIRIDPLSAGLLANRGNILCLKGDLAGARRTFHAALTLYSNSTLSLYYLGVIAAAEGQYAKAVAPLERAYARAPDYPGVRSALAYVYLHVGQRAKSDAMLALMRTDRSDDRARIDRALGEAVMGNVDRAFDGLRHRRWDMMPLINLRANPLLASFRNDPRYVTLLNELGLKP